jgi:hypothetical protein
MRAQAEVPSALKSDTPTCAFKGGRVRACGSSIVLWDEPATFVQETGTST